MKKKYAVKKREYLPPQKETLKQKNELKAQRICRYEKRTKFRGQNNIIKSEKKEILQEIRIKTNKF